MVFNLFKKNKPEFDPLNIKITDLRKGFIFEYDLKEWQVVAEYTYDWGDNYFSKEFKVKSPEETAFLSVEEDDELEVYMYNKIKLSDIEGDIAKEIINNEIPPISVVFDNVTYKRESESPGYFKEEDSEKEWIELISWQYYDSSGEYILNIEQWGDREFEASCGKKVKPFEISNILPGNDV